VERGSAGSGGQKNLSARLHGSRRARKGRAARKKQAQEQRIPQECRKRLLSEVYKRVPRQLCGHEVDLIALRCSSALKLIEFQLPSR
jgi:hypothetical protein